MAFWFIPAAVVVVTLAGKAIYELVSEDNSPSTSSSGESVRENLKAKKESAICERAANDVKNFIQDHNEYLELPNTWWDSSTEKLSCSNVETLKSSYITFLKDYSEKQRRGIERIGLNSAAIITTSLNCFISGKQYAISPSKQYITALKRVQFLKQALKTAQECSDHSVPDILKEYSEDYATTAEAKNLLKLWHDLNQATAMDTAKPRIAVCGMLKAGKSSLLNMLSGHFEDNPPFKVDEIRATDREQILDCGNVLYIDTPGLDATEEDTEKAWQSYLKADCFIFVHALSGELTQSEIDVIARLHRERPKTIESMLVVLTHSEKIDNVEDLSRIMRAISDQLEDILGIRPWISALSNVRYKKGKRENKPKLVEMSHFSFLQEHINSLLEKLPAKARANRKAESAGLMQAIASLIETDLVAAEQKIHALTIGDEKKYAEMLHEYKDICDSWEKEISQYNTM